MRTQGFRSLPPFAVVLLSFLFFFFFTEEFVRGAFAAEFTIETIQKAYETIKDIKGNFVQKSTIKDLKRTDTFKGSFQIKVPSKMRWQYQGDNKQNAEVVINNEVIIIYQKNEKQAFRGKFDRESYGQAPIALLGGFGDIGDEFEVVQKEGKIVLKPRKGMGGVVSVEIAPSGGEFPIGSLTIIDKRSNKIEITFRDIVLNSGIKESAFNLSIPQGTSVYEYTKPQ
jgi:outer membrane lipoprotein-sorting protein